mmetsp:Transcript_78535/g.109129  ORF Transcript_78535/g.109129 Transcript_78535/m.109129 type:complete len:139 (+) Transcript_78535:32-448(+)
MQLMLHPPPYLQLTLPGMFERVNKNHIPLIMARIHENHEKLVAAFENGNKNLAKVFKPLPTNGGETLVVKIPDYGKFKDGIDSDLKLAQALYKEENIIVVPLSAYHGDDGALVFSTSLQSDVQADMINRLNDFVGRHI